MILKKKVLGLFLTLGLTQSYGCNKDERPIKLEYSVSNAVQPITVEYDQKFLENKTNTLFLVSGLEYIVDEDERAIIFFSEQLKLRPKNVDERYEDNKRVLFDSDYSHLLAAIAPIIDFNGDGNISDEELQDMKLINQAKVKKQEVYKK